MLYYYGLENNCSHAHLGLNSLDEGEDVEKKRAHSSLQDRLDKELQELDKCLKQKEAEMKRFAKVDTSALELHYVNKLLELVQEKKALQKEIEELCHNLANISNTSADSAQNLKEDYLMKLNMLEAQVSKLKKKQDAQSQLLRQKQKSDDAAKRLQHEIQRIKSHKLKKEGRRNEYEMHRLLVLNQRQKMVLQRKTEEASLATKRLGELLESKGTCDTSGSGHASGPGIQPLMQAIKHELEVRFRVHEVRTANERQMQERAAMAKEVARLKEESENFKQKIMSDCLQTMSPSARNSRIVAQENMLAATSGMLVCMASQLSEAEEREHVFSGRDRWNQIYSLAEAKNLMNNLFNLASSSRCQLRDKEVTCREKDSVIGELKEKVVTLNSLVKKLEGQLVEVHDQNLQRVASIKSSGENGQSYVLRKEGREKLKVDRISKWRLSRPSRVGVYISTPATQSTQLVPITLIREWQPQQQMNK